MMRLTSLAVLTACLLAGLFFGTSYALKCFLCGQYNDGVGSITPCQQEAELKECPQEDHGYCIKYISEGTLVKDCVAQCSERESWSAKTFCCNEDGCNSSSLSRSALMLIFGSAAALLVIAH